MGFATTDRPVIDVAPADSCCRRARGLATSEVAPARSGSAAVLSGSRSSLGREHGRFAPLICSELLEIESRAQLLGRVDIVMVPAWNRDLPSFEYLLQATTLDLHSFVAIANNGIYSDCRVRGPYREDWRRDACRLLSRGENEIVVANIPVDRLRDYRAHPRGYDQKIKAWMKTHPKIPHQCPWPSWKPQAPR
jgi:hypothetical protein